MVELGWGVAVAVIILVLMVRSHAAGERHAWIYALFFLSGFPALIYQIVWERALFAMYGVNIQSVTLVVTAFMLGLGLGSLAGGHISKIPNAPLLKIFGFVELGIAAFGFVSLHFFGLVARYTATVSLTETGILAFLLVLVPTMLMGLTLPLLVEYVVSLSGNVGHSVGKLYFVNTLGSALACFIAAAFLMRRMGEVGSVTTAAVINTGIGLTVLLLSRGAVRGGAAGAERETQDRPGLGGALVPFPGALLAAAAAGFVSLGYEILWYRMFSFVTGGLARTFAVLLGSYLAGIAFGAVVAEVLCTRGARRTAHGFLALIGGFILGANLIGFLVVPFLANTQRWFDWRGTMPLVGVAAALLGAAFPLIAHVSIAPDEDSGAKLSYLYLANIIGSASGSFVTGFILMDKLPLLPLAVTLALTGIVLAAILLATGGSGRQRLLGLTSCAIVAVLVVGAARPLFDHAYEKLQFKKEWNPGTTFSHVIETKSGVITVTQDGTVYGGGIYDGRFNTSLMHDTNYILRAYAVSAMHPNPREVLMIGLATGSWAQVIVNDPRVEKFTIVEINPGYLDLIPKYPEVASLLKNPKVELVIDDGRRWLIHHPERRFDFIVMNTTFHWRSSATNLLSTDFLEIIRAHLKPGGVHFYNTTESLRVVATGVHVFPYALRVMNFLAVSDQPIQYDVRRWAFLLRDWQIDGKPVFDLTKEEERQRLIDILQYASRTGPSGRWDVVEDGRYFHDAFKNEKIITDDNMGTEWYQ
ncbi:MAG TPA: fused MFS/spermidine synthase [Terriglobales bacterium]|nr:fused MFS/spermidine synthase [Terriglobales bacterium]